MDELFYYYRGRVALSAILKALNIGDGDEVATQAFTCVAVPEAIMATGSRPLYIDIEESGFNMSADDLQRKITHRTRAIIVQHTYGIPAALDSIVDVAQLTNLPIIEDCAHTHVSSYRGETVGSYGVASFYSYEWGKPIVVGIGGGAKINDAELREKVIVDYVNYEYPALIRQVRIQIQYIAFIILFRPTLYWPVRSLFHWLSSLGIAESNYNPVGEGNLSIDFDLRMPKLLQRRLERKEQFTKSYSDYSRWTSDQYRTRIKSETVYHPKLPDDVNVVYARYPLVTSKKNMLLAAARRSNVELAEWYSTPVHPLSGKELSSVNYAVGTCPNAEARCEEVVTLPVHPAVKQRDIDKTVQFLNTTVD